MNENMSEDMIEVKEYINIALKRYLNSTSNIEDCHSRLDELFLLYSYLLARSFVTVVKGFGINYEYFDKREYHKVKMNISMYLRELEDAVSLEDGSK